MLTMFQRLLSCLSMATVLWAGVFTATPAFALTCRADPATVERKSALLQATLQGQEGAFAAYRALLNEEAQRLQQCRSRSWPQTQGIWLRLYPCDLQPGVLEQVFDEIVNQGYNRVYIETFFDGRVALPANRNPTVWPTVVRQPEWGDADLLALALQKSRERGLTSYAWFHGLNFGYSYNQRGDRQEVIARNGHGQTSLDVVGTADGVAEFIGDADKAFVDPYSPQGRADYLAAVNAVLERRPDGLLIDYIRYPRQTGPASVATRVKDLWIYSPASFQALIQRGTNNEGRALIERYVRQGHLTHTDVETVSALYPAEREPLWEGRNPTTLPAASTNGNGNNASGNSPALPPISERLGPMQWQLWLLSVNHAYQGVADFLHYVTAPAKQMGIPTGAVFFPEGNNRVGQGYDSRLQGWERFTQVGEWHAMAYGVCGQTQCIADQVKRVVDETPTGISVAPVLVGVWGRSVENRPPLEDQMMAIRQETPTVNSISHFDFGRIAPQLNQARRRCLAGLPTSQP